jgi:hypothetical protein
MENRSFMPRSSQRVKRTSSLLDCFCLLALTDDPPASLTWLLCWAVSSTGRGMLEAAGLEVKGMFPRPGPRLGVPLRVLPDIA